MATCLLEFMTTCLFDSTWSLLSLAKQRMKEGGQGMEGETTDGRKKGRRKIKEGRYRSKEGTKEHEKEGRKEDEGRKI